MGAKSGARVYNNKSRKVKKMKRSLALIASSLLACALISLGAQARRNTTPQYDRTKTAEALAIALNDPAGEYAARALYKAVIAKLGNVQPFVNILAAEEQHVAALQAQWTKYVGTPVPSDNHADTKFDGTIMDAATLGVDAEEQNIAMYDDLLNLLKDTPNLYPSSVVQVFNNLQSASENNHLPAFEAILASDTTASAATCPLSGVKTQKMGKATQGTGTCPMGCQVNCQTCPNADCPQSTCPNQGTGVKRQQRVNAR
jgi:hypothetical protein